jgi:DNA repair photolyase
MTERRTHRSDDTDRLPSHLNVPSMFSMKQLHSVTGDGFSARPGSACDAIVTGQTPMPTAQRAGPDTHGRGSRSNRQGRFEPYSTTAVDDGWQPAAGDGTGADLEARHLPTTVRTEIARTIITRNTSPDIGFDRSINMYRGCEHGCTYCFARPSHAWLGLSPGLDFETQLVAKANAASLLERELAAPGYRPRMIALGTNTDPYQPVERQWQLTRGVLDVLERTGHPVGIVTKSHLVQRDIDILSRMAAKGLVKVSISITTLDRKLARAMEPRASAPHRRLEAVHRLAEAGIPVGVNVAPVIPGLTCHEMETILTTAREHGARSAGWIAVRLPLEVAELFKEWLLDTAPDRYRRVIGQIRSMRGGKDNVSRFGARMSGEGKEAELLRQRFDLALRRLGLTRTSSTRLRTDLFTPPVLPGGQLSLF